MAYLAPDVLLRCIINKSPIVLKLIKTKKIVTSAFSFWEAMSCLTKTEIKEHSDRIYELLKAVPITELHEITGKFQVEDKKRTKHLRSEDVLKEEPLDTEEHWNIRHKKWQKRLHNSVGWVDCREAIPEPDGVWDVRTESDGSGFECKSQEHAEILSILVQMNERLKRMEEKIK